MAVGCVESNELNDIPMSQVNVSSQEIPSELFMSPDGKTLCVIGVDQQAMYIYRLEVAGDISTASYLDSTRISGYESSYVNLFFSPDSSKMYLTGSSTDKIDMFEVPTDYSISSTDLDETISSQDKNQSI